MPKYRVEVTSRVPSIYTGGVIVEAVNEEAARKTVENMYDCGELELGHDKDDFDAATLTIDEIKEIEP